MTRFHGLTLVPGAASGPTLALDEPLSFWGGLDATTGAVTDRWHPQRGTVLSGRALVMAAGRGSSSGASVLAEAVRLGTAPALILLGRRDAIATVGALVADELYGRACPIVVLEDAAAYAAAAASARISVEATPEGATVTLG